MTRKAATIKTLDTSLYARSMAKNIRGVQKQNELTSTKDLRDIRTFGERIRDSLEKGDLIVIVAAVGLAMMWMLPALMEVLAVLIALFLFYAARMRFSMPFRVPMAAGIPDPSMLRTKSKGAPPVGKGITYMGNSIIDDKELWFTDDDVRTHILIFGTTGAGKALPDDERILTPSGWRRMGDIVDGDQVVGPDGEIQTVEAVHPQGEMDLWRLHLEDGRHMDCTGDHLWAIAPHVRGTMFGTDPDDSETEVIDTRTLSARLGAHEWPDHADGLALPLPVPLDYGKPLADLQELLALARGAMLGLDPFPTRLLDAPLEARQEAWALLLPHSTGAGRKIMFDDISRETARGVCDLAHSLGLWASLESVTGSPQKFQVVVDLAERRLRVVWIERLNKAASCRCISITGSTGLFVAGEWVTTHNTESLLSLAYNCLVQGSGFIYVDGKGDNKLWTRVFSICRSLGREDDLLVINYMTGGRDVFGPQKTKLSNTLNPFLLGSAGGLTDMLVSLMDEAGGDNAMWQNRAISLISSIMFALVFMRDNQGLLMDVDVIREHLILENIEKLSRRRDLPPHALNSLRAYLRSLPGYKPNPPGGQQPDIVGEQHGFLQMQFTKILGMLSESYGHIFRTNLGEVNFFDVVINRRVLVVLLPAMEKAPVELGNLGKIIIAALKQMMATGLGDRLEGTHQEIIETKPTNAPSPFMCILDEYGYYVVKGAAVMPAQARSLNFCMVFAGQDYPSFKKNNNAEEAAATVANCNIKIFMKTEDPTDTADLFEKSVGKALVSRTSGYTHDNGLMGRYVDNKNASVERRERGDLLDLKDQLEGEAHILFKSTLVRATMFYADPPNAKNVKTNSFLRVEPPTMDEMGEYKSVIAEMTKRLTHPDMMEDQISETQTTGKLGSFLGVWRQMEQDGSSASVSGAAALVAAHRQAYAALHSFGEQQREMAEEEDDYDGLDIFTDPRHLEEEEEDEDQEESEDEDMSDDEEDQARDMLLNRERTRTRLADLETAAGAPSDAARERARQITEDIEALSSYPRHTPDPADPNDVITIIQELEDDLGKQG